MEERKKWRKRKGVKSMGDGKRNGRKRREQSDPGER